MGLFIVFNCDKNLQEKKCCGFCFVSCSAWLQRILYANATGMRSLYEIEVTDVSEVSIKWLFFGDMGKVLVI